MARGRDNGTQEMTEDNDMHKLIATWGCRNNRRTARGQTSSNIASNPLVMSVPQLFFPGHLTGVYGVQQLFQIPVLNTTIPSPIATIAPPTAMKFCSSLDCGQFWNIT